MTYAATPRTLPDRLRFHADRVEECGHLNAARYMRQAAEVTPASELAARWIAEAKLHEEAADEIFYDDEEKMLYLEAARVYRKCASELGA